MLEAHAFKSFLPIIRQKKMKTFFLLTTKFNSRYPMSGGVDRVMGIGVLAWRSIHSVEMECITRYVLFPSFSVSFPFSFFTCFIRRGPETCRSQWRKYYLVWIYCVSVMGKQRKSSSLNQECWIISNTVSTILWMSLISPRHGSAVQR